MKAHIPLSGKIKRDAMAEVRVMVEKERELQKLTMSRRFFKLAAVVLNDEFGFGAQRIDKFFGKMNELIISAQDDEIFWEHVDKQVVDRMGFNFDRDYTR